MNEASAPMAARPPAPARPAAHPPALIALIALVALLALLAAGCAGIAPPAATSAAAPRAAAPRAAAGEALTVAAAADLQFAFEEIAALFERETGQPVTLVFGSTGQLTQQIEQGAPYDLLAAANVAYVERLAEQGLIDPDSVALYARGRIVLAVNRQSGAAVAELGDLLGPQVRRVAIANPAHAPYGLAARQALEAAGLWEALQPKLVLGENVRQALQYVQTGDAEAGIVALSVADVAEIEWTPIDEALHAPLEQALGVVAGSPRAGAARAFAAFVNGPAGRPIMQRYGFLLPGEDAAARP